MQAKIYFKINMRLPKLVLFHLHNDTKEKAVKKFYN